MNDEQKKQVEEIEGKLTAYETCKGSWEKFSPDDARILLHTIRDLEREVERLTANSDSWMAVTEMIGQVRPDWAIGPESGRNSAVKAVQQMGYAIADLQAKLVEKERELEKAIRQIEVAASLAEMRGQRLEELERQLCGVRAVLEKTVFEIDDIDNGHCALCGTYRKFNLKGGKQPCSNDDCLSNKWAKALTLPECGHVERLKKLELELEDSKNIREHARTIGFTPDEIFHGLHEDINAKHRTIGALEAQICGARKVLESMKKCRK